MKTDFRPGGLPAWIGSLPVKDHEEAVKVMLEYTPDIPIWVQLPHFQQEGMVAQFAPGMPGLRIVDSKMFVDTADAAFDQELVDFFEEYMAVADGSRSIEGSRFSLTDTEAPGFHTFMRALNQNNRAPVAVKGQVTGPFTFGTGLTDENGRAVFYTDQVRDAATKLIAMKARWQVNQLKKFGVPVIVFLDEPALAGYGSSAFISVSRADIDACFAEVIAAIHEEGGLAGVHVCANAEWPVILDSAADIVSFDAYSYFDKFILYPRQIKRFLDAGGILAWGIVPTGNIEAIAQQDAESLYRLWADEVRQIEALGFSRGQIIAQSLITPSCGTGSLPLQVAEKVIRTNRELSAKVRGE